MFRYFGFHWTPATTAAAAFARQLDESISHTPGWQLAFACAGLRVYTIGSRSGVNANYPLSNGGGVVVGRLFRRGQAAAARGDIALSERDSDCILKTQGQALIDDFWGRYVAVLRSDANTTLVLRDPSGALPCFQSEIDGVTMLFSWLDDLLAFAPHARAPSVNWEAIAALLSIGHLGGRETALEGVAQILPGQLTRLNDTTSPPTSLWNAVGIARRPIDADPGLAAESLRRTVLDCVGAWASCYPAILLRLSGGVDSAILLGSLAARGLANGVTCLNYHSPGSDGDERAYARLAAGKAGVELIERQRDATFALEDVLEVCRTPMPEVYVGRMDASRIDAEVAAAQHAGAMFTGEGGDVLFFQLRYPWPASDYLSVHGLGRGFVRAALDAARLGRVSLWESMLRAVTDLNHGSNPMEGIGRFFTLTRREALDGLRHLARYVHPDLCTATDLPIGKFQQVKQLIYSGSYYDPFLPEESPETVRPLLSQPLIELCLALPTWFLTHGGRGRALARNAFADDMPREIVARQTKGGMEEHISAILQRNLPLARSILLDGQLVRQGLLDRTKLEAALAGRLSASGGYIGEIHHHLATEAWLRRMTALQ